MKKNNRFLKQKINQSINSSYAETIAMEVDILINSRETTNSEIIEAHKIAFPNQGSFSEHVNSFDDFNQKMGVISGVKGKIFELKVNEHLNSQLSNEGLRVRLADDVNQKGWDLVVYDEKDNPVNYFQIKCSDNIDYILSSSEKYPEFTHIVPEDVYDTSEKLIENSNIYSAPYSIDDLEESVNNAHNFIGSIGEFFIPPVFTLGLITVSEITQKPDLERAVNRITQRLECQRL